MKLRRLSLLVFSVFLLFPFVSGDSFSAEDSDAISTDKEAYAAGETITVSGNLATSDYSPVILQIVSPNGNLVDVYQVTPDSEYNFSVDIATSIGGLWKESGTYIIKATHYYSTFETQFSYGGMMSAQVQSPSEESSGVTSESELTSVDEPEDGAKLIQVDGYDLFYQITGANIIKIIPDTENTSLIIQIETFSDGELKITIPREVLDTNEGSFFVLVDGEETYHEEISTSDSWTLIIPFYNGSQEIEIIGTFVIPEFGTAVFIIFVVAIISMIMISAKSKINLVLKP